MNDEPLAFDPDLLDELLCAQLDGELDAAARDLGSSADEIAARLRATPGADDRRAALAAARDLLSATPDIDELVAARLRAKAQRAAVQARAESTHDRRQRRYRVLAVASGLAATVAAVVAIAAGLSGHTTTTSSKSSARAAADAPTTAGSRAHAPTAGPSAAAPALGTFTDVHALAVAAVGATGSPGSFNQVETNDNARAARPTTSPGTTARLTSPQAAAAGCPPPPPVPAGESPVLRATATLSGRDVVVVVYAGNGEHIVAVQDADCTLLHLEMLN